MVSPSVSVRACPALPSIPMPKGMGITPHAIIYLSLIYRDKRQISDKNELKPEKITYNKEFSEVIMPAFDFKKNYRA